MGNLFIGGFRRSRFTFFILIVISFLAQTAFADGKALYNQCISCHGQNAEGNEKAPRLAGQHDWYIVTSFEKFQSSERPNVEGNPHKGLSPEQWQQLATYISGLTLPVNDSAESE